MIFSPLERGQGCVRIHLHDVFINHFVNDYHTPLPLSRGDLIMKWYQNDTIQKKGNFYFETPLLLISLIPKSPLSAALPTNGKSTRYYLFQLQCSHPDLESPLSFLA